jgi:outer membrane protein assembly factor BamC
MNSSIKIAALSLALLSVAGCSTFSDGNDKLDYKTNVKRTAGLEVPPDLTALQRDERFAVPRGTAVSASNLSPSQLGAGIGARPATSVGESGVLPEFKTARIERAGDLRWLSVSMPAERVYPILREFWTSAGFRLTTDSPGTGVLETDWAENRANVPKDPIRNVIGRVFDGLYDSGTRDKYRIRVERRADGGTEIYVSHRGLQETQVGRDQTNYSWAPRPSDPELEIEFLRRILLRLGADEAGANATAAAAKSPAAASPAAQARLNGEVLSVSLDFDRTWREVGLVLDRKGFTVEDRDRSKGQYFVRYIDPEAEAKGAGFFAKLFGKSDPSLAAQQYRVGLKTEGQATQVTVTPVGETSAPKQEIARRILSILAEDIR